MGVTKPYLEEEGGKKRCALVIMRSNKRSTERKKIRPAVTESTGKTCCLNGWDETGSARDVSA